MLTPPQITFLREELATAKNPLFFYDDDADGLCSFLLLYKMHREGHGSIVKMGPSLTVQNLRKVQEYNPDKIFVLDIPLIDQEFLDQVKRPVFWLDHHQPVQREAGWAKIHYFNPRLKDPDAYVPTSMMAWQVSQDPADLWIAAAGCLADWYMPEFLTEFCEKYPALLSREGDLPTMLYKEPVGILVKVFFFLPKGPHSEVKNSIAVLSRIKSPEEILQQTTAAGKFLWKRFQSLNEKYEALLSEAKKKVGKGKLVQYYYTEQQWSFTANLANELAALYPDKIIIIGREKSGEMKCSLRAGAQAKIMILEPLQKALLGLHGYGGGHPTACGAVVKKEDWELFLGNFKREVGL